MQKLTTIKLARVQYIPKTLKPGAVRFGRIRGCRASLCMWLRAQGQHSARSRRMVVPGFPEWPKS